jgi:hypothetical protein
MILEKSDIKQNLISYSKEGGKISGEPIQLFFSEPVDDLEAFIRTYFEGGENTNVWSNSIELEDDYYKIDSVATKRFEDDSKVGSFTVELTPNWMRVYVKEGRIHPERVLSVIEVISEDIQLTKR